MDSLSAQTRALAFEPHGDGGDIVVMAVPAALARFLDDKLSELWGVFALIISGAGRTASRPRRPRLRPTPAAANSPSSSWADSVEKWIPRMPAGREGASTRTTRPRLRMRVSGAPALRNSA